MSDMTPRKAADRSRCSSCGQLHPCSHVRAVVAEADHASATDPAAGGDLAALLRFADENDVATWAQVQTEEPGDIYELRVGRFALRALAALRVLAAAPASEAATEGGEEDADDERPMTPAEQRDHDAYYAGAGMNEQSHDAWAQSRGFNSAGEVHAWVDARLGSPHAVEPPDLGAAGVREVIDALRNDMGPLGGLDRETLGDRLAGSFRSLVAATPRAEGEAAAWSQHLDDTAQYAGGFTGPERDGIRAAARMMRDPNVQAQVAKTVGGES